MEWSQPKNITVYFIRLKNTYELESLVKLQCYAVMQRPVLTDLPWPIMGLIVLAYRRFETNELRD